MWGHLKFTKCTRWTISLYCLSATVCKVCLHVFLQTSSAMFTSNVCLQRLSAIFVGNACLQCLSALFVRNVCLQRLSTMFVCNAPVKRLLAIFDCNLICNVYLKPLPTM